jgi:hypothetical protein
MAGHGVSSVVRDVLRGTVTVDRGGLQGRDGLRRRSASACPLLVGVAADRPVDGLVAAGGRLRGRLRTVRLRLPHPAERRCCSPPSAWPLDVRRCGGRDVCGCSR